MQSKLSVLIVAKPGRLRDGLQAVVMSLPALNVIGLVDEDAALLQALAGAASALVLIDAALPNGEAWILLDQVRKRFPTVQCLLMVNNSRQRRLAESEGIMTIHSSNLSRTQLKGALSRLVPEIDSLKVIV
jgi:DNA-binding NarL/FixJ family response regulator